MSTYVLNHKAKYPWDFLYSHSSYFHLAQPKAHSSMTPLLSTPTLQFI